MRLRSLIVLLLLAALALPSFAAFFKDVPSSKTAAYLALQKLLKTGIIKLPADRKFNGNKAVDMYQLAFILDRLLAYTGKISEVKAKTLPGFYYDIPENHYAYRAVSDLVKLGLFTVPESKTFNGQAKLSRVTFYAYLAAFLEKLEGGSLPAAPAASGYSDVPPDNPSYPYIQKLVGAGLLAGRGNLKAEQPVRRYEMAIFVARILDYYLPAAEKAKQEEVRAAEGYIDIPTDHYAREAVGELVEAGILPPGQGKKFYGNDLIDRYLLVDFISRILEMIVVGEGQQLELASPARAYKDVPISYAAYRPVQKLITLGIIPPGNRRELFYGDRKISRFQMVFFAFSAIERILGRVLTFKAAPAELGYQDVPADHFVYDTIQKLIWLGVLEGGAQSKFEGEAFVDRYELCYFIVDLIKAVYLRLQQVEEVVYEVPVDYGFKTYLNTSLSATQNTTNEAYGQSTNDLSAGQAVSLYVDRNVNELVSAFASLTANYTFGDAALAYPYLDQAYLLLDLSPWVVQLGRTSYYQGYTPFGNSLYIDTSSDLILANYDHQLVNVNTIIGKFVNFADIKLDSKFGTIGLVPKLPPALGWLEFTLGGSLITDLPDPGFTQTLATSVTQTYGGVKVNIFNLLELTIENQQLNFSDPSVLTTIGYSAKEGLSASQYALTYFSEDFGYSLSLGYQTIGDDYFLSNLIDTNDFFFTGQNTESYLLRTVYNSTPAQTIGVDLAYIMRDGVNERTAVNSYYNYEVFESAYLGLSITKVADNTLAKQERLAVSSSFSLTF